MLGKRLKLKRDPSDQKLYVDDDIQITARDLMGTNGVVHIIDRVAVPSESQSITDALSAAADDFIINAIKKTGLIPTFEESSSITFLVPHEKALQVRGTLNYIMLLEKYNLKRIMVSSVKVGLRCLRANRILFLPYTSGLPSIKFTK